MPLDLNKVFHECRTANLREIDATGKTFVSIGANGSWYFDWIQNNCGDPKRHIGVEYYMDKPEGLAGNVEWVANTAGHMPDVESESADIVFSGQNIEHLWKKDILGFLTESHRILKPDGLLVLDSPNRDITAAYGIPHPEHLIEFSVADMRELLMLAGFDIKSCKGLYLCRDPRSGAMLPYATDDEDPPFSVVDPCVSGTALPEHSYLWWIHATRGRGEPDVKRLSAAIDKCWEIAWPERMQRMQSNVGTYAEDDGIGTVQSVGGESGALLFGPYAPIDPGKYRSTVWIKLLSNAADDEMVAQTDVVTRGVTVAVRQDIAAKDLSTSRYTPVSLEFELSEMHFGFQCRLFSTDEQHWPRISAAI
jgi:SAM-dependent methyltransferase